MNISLPSASDASLVDSEQGSVTAIVVTFNSSDIITRCLEALTDCPEVSMIIVVDNKSTDDTARTVSERFPTVQLIQNAENVGFGAANNQGLRRVDSDFGLVLNPDSIVSSKALTALINTANQHPDAAIIGPMLEDPHRKRSKLRTGSLWNPEKTHVPLQHDLEVEFLSGAAMFLRMSLIRHSGFFDPNIFLFHEDDDLCVSARKAGYRLILSAQAHVTHLVGQSTPASPNVTAFKQSHFTWSRLYIEQKVHGMSAARLLAARMNRKISRKLLLAKVLRDNSKLNLLRGRQHAVHCFLNDTKPSTSLNSFRELKTSSPNHQRSNPMQLSACDLCEQSEFEQISNTDRHGQPLQTVICRNCGLVRHAAVPSEEELQQFYSTNYRKQYNGEKTPGARRIMRAWNNGERICRQVAPLLESQSRVLEVGAGIGCTVKVFEKAGFKSEGIDPGGEFLNYSRDKLHANVEVRSLYDLPREHQFDAVLLVHVIEHLRSPKQALQHIAGLIKPGGMFYVECPNLQAPFARRSKLFHSAHIHNYTPSTLRMLAQSCGFRLRERFGDDEDTNLQMLFQHSAESELQIDPANFERTKADLARTDPLPYHLRVRYVTDRIRKLGSYANELIQARAFVEDLVRECAEEAEGVDKNERLAA